MIWLSYVPTTFEVEITNFPMAFVWRIFTPSLHSYKWVQNENNLEHKVVIALVWSRHDLNKMYISFLSLLPIYRYIVIYTDMLFVNLFRFCSCYSKWNILVETYFSILFLHNIPIKCLVYFMISIAKKRSGSI